MKQKPVLMVRICHLHGPLKGQIQEFSQSVITIGRLPSMDICFPSDQAHVSRDTHAKIVRDGNIFKLIDQSGNGTIVNGKLFRHAEVLLKTNDVLTFPPGSPRISFATFKTDAAVEDDAALPHVPSIVPSSAADTDSPPDTSELRVPVPQSARLRTEWIVTLTAILVIIGLLIGLHVAISGNWQDFIEKAIIQPAKSVLQLFN